MSKIRSIVITTPHGNTFQLAAPPADCLVVEGFTDIQHSHVKLGSNGAVVASIPHDWMMVLSYADSPSAAIRSVII